MLSGCVPSENEPRSQETANDIMTAKYTSAPVAVDGILNEPVWQETAVYKMYLSVDRAAKNELQEAGEVRLARPGTFRHASSFSNQLPLAWGICCS